ncbi:hypothetical protein [Butyrivibrio fibrisolvens]|uniref:hypothetical protein n=1 Tax=Butyrivibrio fibrisolvens TaxID=831 RepID=UPI00041E8C04|nr:hypothetical protein [Butyrivibrio fibrisolvens]
MDESALEKIVSAVTDAVESAVEDSIGVLTSEFEGSVGSVSDNISEIFAEGLDQFMSDHQFVLRDGTIVKACNKTRVMSPDKKKVLTCYGGLRVDGKTLMVQTRISCWDALCNYQTEEEVVEALQKVNDAIEQSTTLIEL